MGTAIPEGYTTLTIYLTIRGAAQAIEFYQKAFGAQELFRLTGPDGSIAHAEMQFGNSKLMLAEENPEWGNQSPTTLNGTSGGVAMYVENCDEVFNQAVAAGASIVMPVVDMFYGDRTGTVLDPFGHKWTIATNIKVMTPAEMQTAMDEWMKSMAS